MKAEWTRPEMTILVRTRPEEAVLGVCKNGTGDGTPGLNNANNKCLKESGLCIDLCKSSWSS